MVAEVRGSSTRDLSRVDAEIRQLEAEIEPPPGSVVHRYPPYILAEHPPTQFLIFASDVMLRGAVPQRGV